jgi:hypothetical protein
MMNYQRACETLLINPKDISLEVIRKQYKLMALKYHPDKNSADDAADVYREIKEAHDYLIAGISGFQGCDPEYEFGKCDSECDEDEEDEDSNLQFASTIYQKIKESSSYIGVAASFIETLYNNKTFQKHIFHPILMRILLSCEEKGLQLFETMDKPRAQKVFAIISLYRDAFHISDAFLEKAQQILDLKTDNLEVVKERVILNPNLDDLYNQSVFKLRTSVIVPLWFSELIYEKENIIVECIPELPEHITLDEHNNIHVRLSYLISDVWKKDILEVSVGTRIFTILTRDLKLMPYQIFAHMRAGIPVPNDKNIFKTDHLSNVIIHVLLDI